MKSQLVTTEQAAEILGGIKPNTLENWRCHGGIRGPRYIKCGRLVRYRVEYLEAWLEAQTRQSTSQAAA